MLHAMLPLLPSPGALCTSSPVATTPLVLSQNTEVETMCLWAPEMMHCTLPCTPFSVFTAEDKITQWTSIMLEMFENGLLPLGVAWLVFATVLVRMSVRK